jgi:Regulator of Vps4 activity in the MVB pathway
MAVSRFQIAANKKTALLKQQMREVAVMLSEEPPKEEKARIRAEALIREDNAVEAYEILQLACELLAERIKLISSMKECPADLVSSISTLIWACDRVDIPELAQIKKQFRAKYGKTFEENALNNVGGILNERVVSKLSVQPPAAYLVQVYLERICEQFEVSWKPKVPLTADQMSAPMAAPVGYSVQIAGGTGLGTVTTGMEDINQGTGFNRDIDYGLGNGSYNNGYNGKGGDDNNTGHGGGGGGIPVVVEATPYNPYPSDASAATRSTTYDEVDIFVPAIPTAPTVQDTQHSDNFDIPAAPTGGAGSSCAPSNNLSYDELAAKFNNLRK